MLCSSRWSVKALFHAISPSGCQKPLITCTSSALQKTQRQAEVSPLLLNIFSFLPLSSRGQHVVLPDPYLLITGAPNSNILHALSSAQLTRSESNNFGGGGTRSHMTFCQDIYIIPMVPQSSLLEGDASCGEHLFNLSSSGSGV